MEVAGPLGTPLGLAQRKSNSVNSFGMSGLELVLHGIPRKTKSCFWPQEVTVLLGRVGAERGDIKCEGYWRKELIPEGQGWWGFQHHFIEHQLWRFGR